MSNRPPDSSEGGWFAIGVLREVMAAYRPRYALATALARMLPLFAGGHLMTRIYRLAGIRIGEDSMVLGPLRLVSGRGFAENLHIGRSAMIANDVTINLDAMVRIEDNAAIGPFVRIYTATHGLGPGSRRMIHHAVGKPVVIEKGAWIGVSSVIQPGVTIGRGSVVGAGSVVSADVPANTYVEGNPARVVRELPWGDR